MSFVYSRALGLLNSTTLTGDMRALLVMSNTTADTDEDAEFLSSFGTFDEYDDCSYARVALTSEAFAVDLTNDRFEFTCDPIVFSSLGAGTRQAVGLILYLHAGADSANKPIIYIDGTGFPFAGTGSNVTFTPNAEGVLQIANAA